MSTAFADSYFILAILNPRDSGHLNALSVAAAFPGKIVTTQWVLVEAADALSDPLDRPVFIDYLVNLQRDPNVQIVEASAELFRRGIELFADRSDKSWSLTDCISFVVMRDLKISDALTGDRHFRQAGFVTLL